MSLEVSIPDVIQRGPGRFLLNVSLLSDGSFLREIRSFWASWRLQKPLFTCLQKWWDAGKEKIKGLAISFSSAKKKSCSESKTLLSNLASHLKRRLDAGMVSCHDAYQATLASLAKLEIDDAEAARVHSRVKWAEERECSTSYYLRLAKKHRAQSWFSAIRNDHDTVVTDLNDIISAWLSFYSNLFSSCQTDPDDQSQMLSQLSLTLPSHEVPSCEGLFTVEEVLAALKGMARGKSPGSDGLPVEFFLKLWDTLGSDLVEVLNSSYNSGFLSLAPLVRALSPSCLRKVTVLIGTLAGRLLKVIHYVVRTDQTCGNPGPYIGENVSLLRDIVDLTSERNIPAAIFSLDQEKAFDRVAWGFMFATLQKMGFGPSFISWTRLLYNNARCSILINGYTSPVFYPTHGAQQGCPLSPLLYILTMEVLASNLRVHPDIVDISLPSSPTPLPVSSLYADDTSVIVTSDPGIEAIFDTYSRFEKASGSSLNLGKCKGLWLGAWRGRNDSPVAIDWSSAMIKVLGIFIGFGDVMAANWEPQIEAVSKCLSSLRTCSLSLSGKALVANALALSRIWYVASLVHMPQWVLSDLNCLLFKFFWSDKRDLVHRDVVVQNKASGGFGVVSISLKVHALLAQWVKHFQSSQRGWISLLTFWLFDCFGADPLTVLECPSLFSTCHLPPFYCAVLEAWKSLGGSRDPSSGVLTYRSNPDSRSQSLALPVSWLTSTFCSLGP